MALWTLNSIAIAGGFLSDLSLQLPRGLICVIGPRGSGKSTLAEAIRVALGGVPSAAPKSRLELLKANLGGTFITVTTGGGNSGSAFVIRRNFGQTAVIVGSDSKPVTTVDLDRGTFLPLDAYGSADIEALADETLGSKRRVLLDELRAAELQKVHLQLSSQGRALEANAEAIRVAMNRIRDLTEQCEELGDVQARLADAPAATNAIGSSAFQDATRQKQWNERESSRLAAADQRIDLFSAELETAFKNASRDHNDSVAVLESANEHLLLAADKILASLWTSLDAEFAAIRKSVTAARSELSKVASQLRDAHAAQEATYLSLQHENQEAAKAFEARAAVERQVSQSIGFRSQIEAESQHLEQLQRERKDLKAAYLLTRDNISAIREAVAEGLQAEAGSKVRIRVRRNADTLDYQQRLVGALYGSKLKSQDEILKTLCAIRPEDLAVMLRENDLTEFETHTGFGRERGRRILELLTESIDTLELEVLPIDDQVLIELNVATSSRDHYKDASELSRGQKCTALLPIILARRDSPLVIDQPEDNLDNHFIYETVVDSVRRLKTHRQMIFITHNANIPVLGEADLVVVMNSDGRRGFIEKTGSVDDCRNEIIDLLEGGEEAFELRRKRYGSR